MAKFGFIEKTMNLYHSLTTYSDFPTFSYNWRIKSQQQEIWMKEFKNYIKAYDFFLETDSSDISIAQKDTIKINKFFKESGIRFNLKFSGSKGFHTIVLYEDFKHLPIKVYDEQIEKNVKNFNEFLTTLPLDLKDAKKKIDLVLLFKVLAWRLKGVLGADTIDTSVQDIKRICKVAYSIDCKSGFVAYPLNDSQLENFNKELYTPEKVIAYRNYKRGLMWRNSELSLEQRQRNVTKLLLELAILK